MSALYQMCDIRRWKSFPGFLRKRVGVQTVGHPDFFPSLRPIREKWVLIVDVTNCGFFLTFLPTFCMFVTRLRGVLQKRRMVFVVTIVSWFFYMLQCIALQQIQRFIAKYRTGYRRYTSTTFMGVRVYGTTGWQYPVQHAYMTFWLLLRRWRHKV